MTRDAVGAANIVLGLIYAGYGLMALLDFKHGWRTRGFSHFGAAWVAMAFTCGPHHLEHGVHVLAAGGNAGTLDLAAVLVGAPAGLVWFLLRVEALVGGPGDRFVVGTPWWIVALPYLAVGYVAALAAESGILLTGSARFSPRTTPNLLLLGIYGLIGWYLARSQIENRREVGGWSVSGLALAVVFPTCGLMHVFFAEYAATGVYDLEWPGVVIDWLAVPAAIYFVWVVRALYRGRLTDWNESAGPLQPAAAGG